MWYTITDVITCVQGPAAGTPAQHKQTGEERMARAGQVREKKMIQRGCRGTSVHDEQTGNRARNERVAGSRMMLRRACTSTPVRPRVRSKPGVEAAWIVTCAGAFTVVQSGSSSVSAWGGGGGRPYLHLRPDSKRRRRLRVQGGRAHNPAPRGAGGAGAASPASRKGRPAYQIATVNSPLCLIFLRFL